jgi:hypothetical protein
MKPKTKKVKKKFSSVYWVREIPEWPIRVEIFNGDTDITITDVRHADDNSICLTQDEFRAVMRKFNLHRLSHSPITPKKK